ncbi:esterase/lipase family protein [Bradyrhizobium japonicum]|uniref:esterase/lipase family protein n=1 Tax=Bradyrhizobium japonicum TaxID=375 RepID=UPI002010B007|nr:alpha/beta fold hydrolase [Bradyrhizobium japonicum]UQE01144.1 alpha/beta fold hydrolase [Bradyrhizobium japonicum]
MNFLITFVHGTFARSAPWTLEGSTLRNSILQALGSDVEFNTFNWSGRNTHHARLEAGRALGRLLVSLQSQYPDKRQVLIAHSHGGNVALHALKAAELKRISVITLNTPFTRIRPRDLTSLFAVLFECCFLLVWLVAMLFFLFLGFDLPPILSYTLIAFLFGWGMFPLWLDRSRVGRSLIERLLEGIEERTFKKQRVLHNRLCASTTESRQMLILTVVGDEAEAFLRFFDFFGSVPVRIINFLLGMAEALAEQGVSDRFNRARFIANQATPFLGPLAIPIAVLFGFFALFSVFVILLSIPIFALVAIRRVSHWDDRLVDSVYVNISSSEHPEILDSEYERTECDAEARQFFKRYVVKKAGMLAWTQLKHSQLYGDNEVVSDICSWLQARTPPDGAFVYGAVDELIEDVEAKSKLTELAAREAEERERRKTEAALWASLTQQEWALLSQQLDASSLRGFLEEFPDGVHAAEAKSKLTELERQAEAAERWKRVKIAAGIAVALLLGLIILAHLAR